MKKAKPSKPAAPPTPVVFVAPRVVTITRIENLQPGVWVYLRNGGLDVPAMVTKVVEAPDVVNLTTIEDGNATLHPYAEVKYSESNQPLTWHWMTKAD